MKKEAGKVGMKMKYAYVVCPVCWDKLIEVKSEEEYVSYRKDKCSKCGTHFGLAFRGKKIDDTTYQIIFKRGMKLDDMRITSMRKGLRNVHLDADDIMRSISVGKQGNIIYEGDAFRVYLFIKVFLGYEPWIEFEIIPEFPYEIYEPNLLICPKCGADVIGRTEPYNDIKGWFLDGFFCEHCNKWTLGPTVIRDTTTYELVFSYKKLKSIEDNSVKRGIMNRLKSVQEKKIQGDQMIVHSNSEGVIEIVPFLRTAGLTYDIEPPFPHKIE